MGFATASAAHHQPPRGGSRTPPFTAAPSEALGRLGSALPDQLRQRLRSGRELARTRVATPLEELFPTTLPAVDHVLAGGLPRGCLVELVGRRSSGRFSAVLATLAATTAAGDAAALVDLGDGLDPQATAAAGADLERLLWVRPSHLKQALIATEMLLAAGFPLVVLEMGNPPVPGGRGVEAAWLRLARSAVSRQAALLVSSPYRASGPAAATVLKTHHGRPAWQGRGASPRLLAGLSSRITLEKLHNRPRECAERLTFTLPAADPESRGSCAELVKIRDAPTPADRHPVSGSNRRYDSGAA